MSKLQWDRMEDRLYETGLDMGVLFVLSGGRYRTGEAWNGLITITESPSGAEPSPFYADNIKYFNLLSSEDYGVTIEAYNSPDGFNECEGKKSLAAGVYVTQQSRKHFGFVYRSFIGSAIEGNDHGYAINIIFDALAKPTEKANNTQNESPEPMTKSWECSTSPIVVGEGYKPTARIKLVSTAFKMAGLMNVLRYIEDRLYGTDDSNSTFMTLTEIMEAYNTQQYLLDSNGDFVLDSEGHPIQSFVQV